MTEIKRKNENENFDFSRFRSRQSCVFEVINEVHWEVISKSKKKVEKRRVSI